MADETTDDEAPDATARTLAYVEATKLFSFVGLDFGGFMQDHEDAAETLIDYFVLNDAQFPDDFPGLGGEPTDEELEAMPDVRPVGETDE